MGPLDRYRSPADLPDRIPIFPLAGALLLPRTALPLNIFEPRYLEMVTDALSGARLIGMVQPARLNPLSKSDERPAVERIGCAGRLTSYSETSDGRFQIVLTGICRFMVGTEIELSKAYRVVETDFRPFAHDLTPGWGEAEVDRGALVRTLRSYLDARRLAADWNELDAASTEALVNVLSVLSPYPAGDKQALLEARDLRARSEILIALTEMALARGDGDAGARLQ